MEIKQLDEKEKKLFAYCQYLRLEKSKKVIEGKQKTVELESNQNKDLLKGAKNLFKGLKKDIMGYDETAKKIDEELSKFCEANGAPLNDNEAVKLKEELYQYDDTGVAKLLFACCVCLDNQFKYEFEDDGLEAVSMFLFSDSKKLSEIRDEFETNYRRIMQDGYDESVFLFSVAFAISVLVLAIGTPLAIGGIIAGSTFGGMVAGGVISALLFGFGLTNDKLQKKRILQEFRNLTPNEQGLYLALQLMIVGQIKDHASSEDLKTQLDDVLKTNNALKSDLDFYTFIEHENIKNNKEKMEQFHRFDKLLFKQLDL